MQELVPEQKYALQQGVGENSGLPVAVGVKKTDMAERELAWSPWGVQPAGPCRRG